MAVPPEHEADERPSWTLADQISLAVLTIGGLLLRIVRVSDPAGIMFDETYYAKDACWYLLESPSTCEIDVEQTQVHPPLAKWLIAIGIRIWGYNSFGWRVASVVAGTLSIVLLYLLARKILKSTLGATFAAGLLAIDFLHFVQSRIAMIDIFVPMFGLAALLFVVYDRDRMVAARASDDDASRQAGVLDRPWRLFAGIAGGAAVACKWSGGLVLVTVIALTVVWELSSRRRDGRGSPMRRFFLEESPSIMLWLFAVPIVLYVATYAGRIHGTLLALPWSEGSWLGALIDHHRYMLDFHRGLDSSHPYLSPAWSWIMIKRPVSYFYCGGGQCNPPIEDGMVKEIFAAGSPFVWWTSVIALAYVGWRWARKRDWLGPEGIIAGGFLLTYGPWLLPWFADREAVFLFYLLPTIPFMCLAVAYVATRIGWSWEAKAAIGGYAVVAAAMFVFYYPLLANVVIPQAAWDARIWVFDRCDKPPGKTVTTTLTQTQDDLVTAFETTTVSDADLPPKGWCWI